MHLLLNSLHWGSPLGTGLFLICLGVFIYLLSLADKNKSTKKKK